MVDPTYRPSKSGLQPDQNLRQLWLNWHLRITKYYLHIWLCEHIVYLLTCLQSFLWMQARYFHSACFWFSLILLPPPQITVTLCGICKFAKTAQKSRGLHSLNPHRQARNTYRKYIWQYIKRGKQFYCRSRQYFAYWCITQSVIKAQIVLPFCF